MELPSFEEFWNSLPEGEISKWADEANSLKLKFSTLPIDNESMSDNITNAATINLIISRNMLAAYHKWLSQQLSHQ